MDLYSLLVIVLVLLGIGVLIVIVNRSEYGPIPTPIMFAIAIVIVVAVLFWLLRGAGNVRIGSAGETLCPVQGACAVQTLTVPADAVYSVRTHKEM